MARIKTERNREEFLAFALSVSSVKSVSSVVPPLPFGCGHRLPRVTASQRRSSIQFAVSVDEPLDVSRRTNIDVFRDVEAVQGDGLAEPDVDRDDVPRLILRESRVAR